MKPDVFYGVDFSGAMDAGRRLWVARAVLENGRLTLESCLPGRSLAPAATSRSACHAALVQLVLAHPEAAFGFDFPFSLPASFLAGASWVDFARAFPTRFETPEAFRHWCRAQAQGKEPKRETDQEAQVPFGGFNLRVFRQTYFGIRDVLAPLLVADAARVLPMQLPAPGRASVIEICPASTLKDAGLYREGGKIRPYKLPTEAARRVRLSLLTGLKAGLPGGFPLAVPEALDLEILDNAGGDALDAVIAACSTARALAHGPAVSTRCRPMASQEGYIYV